MVPATKEPMAAVASAWAARAGLGHLVALDRGDHRGGLARGVQQDRGGRAAVHAAVVDAGEHDERAGRLQGVGDRQQQRDGHGRADAGQHADGGAEEDADQGVEQVRRGQRGGEPVHQGGPDVHQSIPSRMPGGQADAEAEVEAVEGHQRRARREISGSRTKCRLPRAQTLPQNRSAPEMTQPSASMSSDVGDEGADQRAARCASRWARSGRRPRPPRPRRARRAGR